MYTTLMERKLLLCTVKDKTLTIHFNELKDEKVKGNEKDEKCDIFVFYLFFGVFEHAFYDSIPIYPRQQKSASIPAPSKCPPFLTKENKGCVKI